MLLLLLIRFPAATLRLGSVEFRRKWYLVLLWCEWFFLILFRREILTLANWVRFIFTGDIFFLEMLSLLFVSSFLRYFEFGFLLLCDLLEEFDLNGLWTFEALGYSNTFNLLTDDVTSSLTSSIGKWDLLPAKCRIKSPSLYWQRITSVLEIKYVIN